MDLARNTSRNRERIPDLVLYVRISMIMQNPAWKRTPSHFERKPFCASFDAFLLNAQCTMLIAIAGVIVVAVLWPIATRRVPRSTPRVGLKLHSMAAANPTASLEP